MDLKPILLPFFYLLSWHSRFRLVQRNLWIFQGIGLYLPKGKNFLFAITKFNILSVSFLPYKTPITRLKPTMLFLNGFPVDVCSHVTALFSSIFL